MQSVAQQDDNRTITIIIGREHGHALLPGEVESAIHTVAQSYDEPAAGGNGTDGDGVWWRWTVRGGDAVETLDLRVEGAAEIAAASEALANVEEHVRRALCGVLDRLGADGATAFINGDSPEKLSDDIYGHVRELEERAMVSPARPTYECDALCPSPGNAEGARCHVKGPHTLHEATQKFTTGWSDRLTQEWVSR